MSWRPIVLVALAGIPALAAPLAHACQWRDEDRCQERLKTLVQLRMAAIEAEFGIAFDADRIAVRVLGRRERTRSEWRERGGYDAESATLVLPRRFLSAEMPNPLSSVSRYWRVYESWNPHEEFPFVERIDELLWEAYLQQSAQRRGRSWPHQGCASEDIEERLPCEMLVAGIFEHLHNERERIFNANRLELIWPESLSDFQQRLWRDSGRLYDGIRRYGGIMLVRPLIHEFGLARTLQYVAQTPFEIENDNVRESAQRYLARARLTIM